MAIEALQIPTCIYQKKATGTTVIYDPAVDRAAAEIDNGAMQQKQTLSYWAGLFVFAGAVVTLENFGVLYGVSMHWPILPSLLGTGLVLLFFQRQKNIYCYGRKTN